MPGRHPVSSPGWAPSPGKAPAPSPFPYPGETEPKGRQRRRRCWDFEGSQTDGEVDRGMGMESRVSPGFWGFTPPPKPEERDAVDEGTPGTQSLPRLHSHAELRGRAGAFGVLAEVGVKQGYPVLLSSNQTLGTHMILPSASNESPVLPWGVWEKLLMLTQPYPQHVIPISLPPPSLAGLQHLGRPLLLACSHSQTLGRQGKRGSGRSRQ